MRAAYAAQRAEIGPRGYDDRIYRRKAKATPHVHALTAEAEHLLTLRETHRLTDIPAVAYDPALARRSPGPRLASRAPAGWARHSRRVLSGDAAPGARYRRSR